MSRTFGFPKPTPRLKERKPLKSRLHPIPADVKLQVFEQDGYLCGWCKVPGGALDAHHVTRRSQGGRDVASNLKAVHRLCHRAIHDNPMEAKRRGFLA
jgi:5-methylcytosine-specific restriction endonuclease McrA